MSKLAFLAAAATMVLSAAAAQAQVQSRGHDARSESLATYNADVAVALVDRSDMNVMGLRVPIGFRKPATVNQHVY